MNKSFFIISFVFWIVFSSITSCKHEPILPDPPNDTTKTNKECSTDTVYFINTILPLLTSNCATSGCHDAISSQKGIDLSSYSAIITSNIIKISDPQNSDLYEVITETDPAKRMPPSGSLSNNQIESILTWIEQGAKNNYCESDCDTLNVSFSSDVFPIIQNNCQSCHNSTSASGSVSLSNYSEIQSKASDGFLLGVIEHQTGYKPMPPTGIKLSDCDIQIIKNWIQSGTLNN